MQIQNKYGYCEYSFERDFVHIYNLYIYPEYRKQGKAREILQRCIDKIRSLGYNDEIQIVAQPQENSISYECLKQFYESLGLKVFSYYG